MANLLSDAMRAKIETAWPDLLARIGAGELMKDILALHGLDRTTLNRWLAQNPERDREWDHARRASADSYFERALVIADTPSKDQIEASDKRTRTAIYQWAARIRNPDLYGDRQNVNVKVTTIDLTRVIQDAQARLAASRVIDGVVLRAALPAPALDDLL